MDDDYGDDDYQAPPPQRRATTATPTYRTPGGGGVSARPQVGVPNPMGMPGATPRRAANVPNQSTAIQPYHDEYSRPMPPARRPQVRRPVQEQPTYRNNEWQLEGSNLKIALIGVGLLAVLIFSYLIVSFAVNTWQTWQDDLTYGRPRLTRLEANVGHNEVAGVKTMFIAQNLHGQLSIIEFPGGDPSKTRVIVGPRLYGKEKDLIPVKLETRDVNADGQADLIATADEQQLIYINDNGNFRPINDLEHAKLTGIGKEAGK